MKSFFLRGHVGDAVSKSNAFPFIYHTNFTQQEQEDAVSKSFGKTIPDSEIRVGFRQPLYQRFTSASCKVALEAT